jgi:hypothetical protein
MHRDPVEVLPSVCSLCEIDRAVFATAPDRLLIGKFWMRRRTDGLSKALQIRDKDVAERYVDIRYQDFVSDPVATVQKIYAAHESEYSSEFENAMRVCLEENRQHKYGKHDYTFDEYGLDAGAIDSSFADYRARFEI